MKTIVTKALFLFVFVIFCSVGKVFSQPGSGGGVNPGIGNPSLPGQSSVTDIIYAQNEFIVLFSAETLESQKQEVRDWYNVSQYLEIGSQLELWQELIFPMTVQDDPYGNTYVTLINVQDLKAHIDLQNGTQGANQDDIRAEVNGGDFNYTSELPNTSTTQYSGQFDPTPICADDNYRIFGQNGTFTQEPITIVIIDQLIMQPQLFSNSGLEIIDYLDFADPSRRSTGINLSIPTNHAEQIGGLIQDILVANNIPRNFINLGVFHSQHGATYATLLKAFHHLQSSNINNGLVNFSANILVDDQGFGQAIWDEINTILDENNLLLISSAGNQGLENEIVFPGSANLSHEITVAGTENCYTDIWSSSNTDPIHFELLSEASDILVPANENNEYQLANGTSYSTALVTAVAAQVATHFENFDALLIKDQLLNNADQDAELTWAVQQGRVLNATNATTIIQAQQQDQRAGFQEMIETSIDSKSRKSTEIQIMPNPFSASPQISMSSLSDSPNCRLQLFNAQGGLVWVKDISAADFPTDFAPDWELLSSGVYFLRWQTQQSFQTLKLIKR